MNKLNLKFTAINFRFNLFKMRKRNIPGGPSPLLLQLCIKWVWILHALHITSCARISVPTPGPSKVACFLDQSDVGGASPDELGCNTLSTIASTKHKKVDVFLNWFSFHSLTECISRNVWHLQNLDGMFGTRYVISCSPILKLTHHAGSWQLLKVQDSNASSEESMLILNLASNRKPCSARERLFEVLLSAKTLVSLPWYKRKVGICT